MNRRRLMFLICWSLASTTILVLTGGDAAKCIIPAWEREPVFPPGSTFWRRNDVKNCPIIYRKVIDLKHPVAYLSGRAVTAGYFCIYIDGQEVMENVPDKGEEKNTPVEVDLTPYATKGRQVLAFSVSGGDLAMELVAAYPDGSRDRITTDDSWRVQKFPPLTMLEFQPWMKPDFDDSGWSKVHSGEPTLELADHDAERIAEKAVELRLRTDIKDCQWRLEMLSAKGIAIRDWEARGFGGPDRLDAQVIAVASEGAKSPRQDLSYVDMTETLVAYTLVMDEVDNFANLARHYTGTGAAEAEEATGVLSEIRPAAEQGLSHIRKGSWAVARTLLGSALQRVSSGKEALRKTSGMPVNELNQALFNKVGWLDCPDMMDNQIEKWGIRVNPVEISWKIDLSGKWRFRTDPKNEGVREGRQSLDYDIEKQWAEIEVPGKWEEQGYQQDNPHAPGDNPFGKNIRTDGPYNGYAWYRKRVKVPTEWSGNDLELVVGVIDDWDWTYFNGELVGEIGGNVDGWWTKERAYSIPKDLARFGKYNAVAVRIYDCGAGGGIVQGPVEIRCPALKEAVDQGAGSQHKLSTVYESPLSPAALITTGENDIALWGWDERQSRGPQAIILPINGEVTVQPVTEAGVAYDADKHGRLSENWVCLWMDVRASSNDLPIQFVLEEPPSQIAVDRGGFGISEVRLNFRKGGVWLVALRPVRTPVELSGEVPPPILSRLRFWSRAVLAYPTSFTEVARRNASDPWRLDITDTFTYRMLSDAWNTLPQKVAFLPPLASFADKVNWLGFRSGAEVQRLDYSLGEWGELYGVVGSDHVPYSIPVDRLKRMGGFSDFCFSGVDLGGPGNDIECKIMRSYGCNSWRPQSNEGGEPMRRTIRLANDSGLNVTVNCDARFAGRPEALEHYRQIAAWAKDSPDDAVSYDLINEPADIAPSVYNPHVLRITEAIRSMDQKHIIYVETPHSYASVGQFINLEPTGDRRTVYSFHDYDFRLPQRWPSTDHDIRSMLQKWIPAFKFSIQNNVPIHLGEFGAFHQTPNDPWHNKCTLTLMADYFRIFDQFGWHFHYYNNRSEMRVRPDGSATGNLVHEAMRRCFERGTFNCLHESRDENSP